MPHISFKDLQSISQISFTVCSGFLMSLSIIKNTFFKINVCILCIMFECLSSYFLFIPLTYFTIQFHCFIQFPNECFDHCKRVFFQLRYTFYDLF